MVSNKTALLVLFLSLTGQDMSADTSGWKTLLGVVGTAFIADTAFHSGEKVLEGKKASEGLSNPVKTVCKSEKDENEDDRGVVGLNLFGVEVDVTYRENVSWTRFVRFLRVRGEVDGWKALTLIGVYALGKGAKLC